jgi:molybdopterin-containing oxidoreductase family iron-sulfur binding subunit
MRPDDDEREGWMRALEARVTSRPWRGFGELLDSPEFRASVAPEFPAGVDLPPSESSRRGFLRLLGASIALAGLAGCTRAPREKIIPYASQPPEVTPGVPMHYATAIVADGYATGLLVESHEGRPTKVEGNPAHPSSNGSSGALEQASVLSLYDPSRARGAHHNGAPQSFTDFVAALGPAGPLRAGLGKAGEGLHVLMEPTSSPTTIGQLERLGALYPRAKVHFYTPLARDAAWHGAATVFGRPLETHIDLSKCDVVVALDADLLAEGPTALRSARDFARRRRVRARTDTMNRLYVVEGALTVTGGMADHRLRVRRSDVAQLAGMLLAELARATPNVAAELAPRAGTLRGPGERAAWLVAVAKDLRAHAGRSVVVVGDGQPAAVHAIAHAMNAMLGNLGSTVTFTEPVIYQAGTASHGLGALVAALDSRAVETLLILGGNPAYTAPVDVELGRRIRLAKESVYLGLYENETAHHATWFLPQAHFLESWADARAYDGTASVVQPLIEPLFAGRTLDEVLVVVTAGAEPTRIAHPTAHELVRDHWSAHARGDFEAFWESALHAGVIEGSTRPPVAVETTWSAVARALAAVAPAAPGLEISFPSDPRVREGSLTNNAWLLELPDPITKLTWENALLISPRTAMEHGLATEDLVEVKLAGRIVVVPVLVAPGHADDTVSLSLGYGRGGAEALAKDLGVNANALRSAGAPRFALGVSIERRPGKHRLASTQEHWSMEGRDLVRSAPLDTYQKEPSFAKRPNAPTASLYKLPLVGKQQWAMSIDLNACTGCSACVIACQAENNSPVVGKEGVLMHREMHWMRIDRYFEGPVDDPSMSVQPMLCQHCEKAPCEYVCPVNATVHSPDGLNEQVYNRCVGTRFCSNNCAWKVRRFNWFNYHELAVRQAGPDARALHTMVMNPDVTVRARGVMEKCTYCVQRIREKEIRSRISGVPIADGDVVTACAQACPSQAIVFGSLTIPGSDVKKLRQDDRDYAVLGELGTEPRTRYLARLRNPNPEMPK